MSTPIEHGNELRVPFDRAFEEDEDEDAQLRGLPPRGSVRGTPSGFPGPLRR
jgi:hypothetical protein